MQIVSTLVPYLVGAATTLAVQAVIQLYVVPRVETRKRREDRWERNVLELGELLTRQVSDRAHDVRLAQSVFRVVRKRMSRPEFDQDQVAQAVAEHGEETQRLTWDFRDLIRTRVQWLAERIWAPMPDVIETREFQLAVMLYLTRASGITGWFKNDDRTDAAYEEAWEKERAARVELITQVKQLADRQHPPRASRLRQLNARWRRATRTSRPQPTVAGSKQPSATDPADPPSQP